MSIHWLMQTGRVPGMPKPPELTPAVIEHQIRHQAIQIAANARIAKSADELIALSDRLIEYARTGK